MKKNMFLLFFLELSNCDAMNTLENKYSEVFQRVQKLCNDKEFELAKDNLTKRMACILNFVKSDQLAILKKLMNKQEFNQVTCDLEQKEILCREMLEKNGTLEKKIQKLKEYRDGLNKELLECNTNLEKEEKYTLKVNAQFPFLKQLKPAVRTILFKFIKSDLINREVVISVQERMMALYNKNLKSLVDTLSKAKDIKERNIILGKINKVLKHMLAQVKKLTVYELKTTDIDSLAKILQDSK
jgi:hypothetical protein